MRYCMMDKANIKRVAIIGANGQVGAEICEILRDEGVDLVPICRNRMGSAYLRYKGIACRHGYATNEDDMARLVSDCDVIVNLALGSGTLREAREANNRLISNIVQKSNRSAIVIHFSTISVYGDPYPKTKFRWKNLYAKEKMRCDKLAIKFGRRHGKDVYVLRLGHVCGRLQNITRLVREQLNTGRVMLRTPERLSNVVYTATIVDAILKIADGSINKPGTYDLLNNPQWSWRQVYEYEARSIDSAEILIDGSDDPPKYGIIKGIFRLVAKRVLASPVAKEYAMRVIATFSPSLNKRIQANYYKQRAANELKQMTLETDEFDALKWREVGWRFLDGLEKTEKLLDKSAEADGVVYKRWPEDMPNAR